jgi:hypothetical protein
LLDKLLEGDTAKVKEIKDFLLKEEYEENYAVFYPVEYQLILYWTKEYNVLLEAILKDYEVDDFTYKIKPERDLLFPKLGYKSWVMQYVLEEEIKSAELSDLEKDFLILNLNYYNSLREPEEVNREKLNELANVFLNKYPQSLYENYIRDNVRRVFVLSKWGFGMDFFTGYCVLTKDLSKNFNNPVPIGIAFDISYKRLVLYLRNFIGFSKNKNDITYTNGIWSAGSQVRVYLPEASFGFVILDHKRVKLAPFAGIASTNFSPTENDIKLQPDVKQAQLEFTHTYTAGLNIDIKTGKARPNFVSMQDEVSYSILRVRYAYNAPGSKENTTSIQEACIM